MPENKRYRQAAEAYADGVLDISVRSPEGMDLSTAAMIAQALAILSLTDPAPDKTGISAAERNRLEIDAAAAIQNTFPDLLFDDCLKYAALALSVVPSL